MLDITSWMMSKWSDKKKKQEFEMFAGHAFLARLSAILFTYLRILITI